MKKNITAIAINKVTHVLSKLQNEYPEVYSLMDEEPFGHLLSTKQKIDNETLLNYVTDVETLLQQLYLTHSSLKKVSFH